MNYGTIRDMIDLLEQFEQENAKNKAYADHIEGFKKWIIDQAAPSMRAEPEWEGKSNGRSAESVINTMIVHMNRYAKSYSKSAILGSAFGSQEDFIYLINLKAFGPMSKMELIRKNVHEKPMGMQIISRLVRQGWVDQRNSDIDKRSKMICITTTGMSVLEQQMDKIRKATQLVTGDLTEEEKMDLIRLLNKLDIFHQAIYDKNIDPAYLLDQVK